VKFALGSLTSAVFCEIELFLIVNVTARLAGVGGGFRGRGD